MKRFFLSFLTLTLLVMGLILQPLGTQAQESIPITVDNLPLSLDVAPIIEEGRTLLPFRAVAEALGISVTWDETSQTITALNKGTTIQLILNNPVAYVNGQPRNLDVPARLVEARCLVPLRFLTETLACKIEWLGPEQGIKIFSPPEDMNVLGFYALGTKTSSSWLSLFGKPYPEVAPGHTDLIDEVALGWYSLDKEGNLLTKSSTGWQRPEGWEQVLAGCKVYNLHTTMVIHATDKDSNIVSLLTDQAAVDKAISSILEEVSKYDGINLDFEGLGFQEEGPELSQTQQYFTSFVQHLAGQLKALDKTLTLTLHAPNTVYKGYDYQGLGVLADKIVIMAYDYGTKPEPAELVTQAVENAKAVVPSNKLLLGISAPSETPESLIIKVGIAKRYDLQGIALWRLGLISEEMWSSLANTIQPIF